ncbi:MAG: metal ABC transporter ATP-binding protein [Defluviitaleaceae bacterium]|nr:metal ABC transporter ATP-binding protein [Defluviitaleaceae bacterium]
MNCNLKEILSVNNLSVSYSGIKVLENISFSVSKGKLIGIIGPNGAGKSTLIKAILKLVQPSSGTVAFDGEPMENIKKVTSYVKQRVDNDLNFPIQVKDVVMLGLFPKIGLFRYPRKIHRKQVMDALQEVEMAGYAKAQIGELSGGQLQRVFLARVLAQNAQIIFLDEPFAGIDADSEQKIMKILRRLRDDGKTIITVYHDLNNVADYFDEIIILNKEVIAYGDTKKVFTKENIAKAYAGSFIKIFSEGGLP